MGAAHRFSASRENSNELCKGGAKPQETLCVGDEVRDIEAALKVNASFGAVVWGYTRPDALAAYPGISIIYTPDDIVRKVLES